MSLSLLKSYLKMWVIGQSVLLCPYLFVCNSVLSSHQCCLLLTGWSSHRRYKRCLPDSICWKIRDVVHTSKKQCDFITVLLTLFLFGFQCMPSFIAWLTFSMKSIVSIRRWCRSGMFLKGSLNHSQQNGRCLLLHEHVAIPPKVRSHVTSPFCPQTHFRNILLWSSALWGRVNLANVLFLLSCGGVALQSHFWKSVSHWWFCTTENMRREQGCRCTQTRCTFLESHGPVPVCKEN